MSPFHKAERRKAKLRLALCGPSGSGKTYSALLVARGLVGPSGRIALIDTERGSGELYANLTEYDVAPLDAPFTPNRYVSLIRDAEAGGYDAVVIDSLSHAWSGEGGVLDMKEKAEKSQRNSFAAWRDVTPAHNVLVEAILQSNAHVIVTMRTKTAYDLVEENGKKKPVKVGLAPVQREGMEYEFTVVMDLSIEGHVATASKDRTSLFDGQHFVPDAKTGEVLKAWLESGVDPDAASQTLLEDLRARAIDCNTVETLTDLYRATSAEMARLTPAHRQAFIDACAQVKKGLQKADARRQPEEQAGLDFPGEAPAAAA